MSGFLAPFDHINANSRVQLYLSLFGLSYSPLFSLLFYSACSRSTPTALSFVSNILNSKAMWMAVVYRHSSVALGFFVFSTLPGCRIRIPKHGHVWGVSWKAVSWHVLLHDYVPVLDQVLSHLFCARLTASEPVVSVVFPSEFNVMPTYSFNDMFETLAYSWMLRQMLVVELLTYRVVASNCMPHSSTSSVLQESTPSASLLFILRIVSYSRHLSSIVG